MCDRNPHTDDAITDPDAPEIPLVRWTIYILLVAFLLGLLLCSGCAYQPPSDGPAILQAVGSGRYELIERCVWYHGRWVRVLEPKRPQPIPAKTARIPRV